MASILGARKFFASVAGTGSPGNPVRNAAPAVRTAEADMAPVPADRQKIRAEAASAWHGASKSSTGPIFHAHGHTIDRQCFMHFVKSLNDILPPVPGKYAGIAHDKTKLSAVLERMFADAYLAEAASHTPASCEQEAMLALQARDGYAKASEIAGRIAKALRRKGLDEDAKKYHCLSQLCEALKRKHLSKGSAHVLDAYVKSTAAEMAKHMPGLQQGRSGASMEKSAGGRFFLRAGPLGIGRAGGGVTRSEKFFVDTDGDYNRTVNSNLHAEFGAKLDSELIRIFKGMVASVRIGGSWGSGIRQSDDLEKMIRMLAIEEADRSIWKSASPRSRKAIELLRTMERAIASPFRILSRPASIPLYLNEKKIAKGAFNESVMTLFAEQFDGPEGSALKSLIDTAFPNPAVAKDAIGQGSNPMDCIPLSEPAGATNQHGSESAAAYKGADISVGLGWRDESVAPVGFRWNLNGKLSAESREIGLERLKAAHAHLDPGYHRNPDVSERIFSTLDTSAAHDAKLHVYRKVNALLEKDAPAVTSEPMKATIDATPGVPLDVHERANYQVKLAAFEHAFAVLESEYQTFTRAAQMLNSAWDHLGVCPMIDDALKEKIRNGFSTINQEIWGEGYDFASKRPLGGCLPSGLAHVRFPVEAVPLRGKADMRQLLAKSYDALSLALASAGDKLAALKTEVASGPFAGDTDIAQRMRKADEAYKLVRHAIDEVNLPMSRDTLLRQSTVISSGVSKKFEVKARFVAEGGAKLSFLEAASEAAKVNDQEGSRIAIPNQAGYGSVSAEVSYIYSQHPNFAKAGHSIKLRATVGVGFPIDKIVAVTPTAFKWLAMAGGSNANKSDAGDKLKSALAAVQLPSTENQAEINVSLHATATSGFAVEYVRVNFANEITVSPKLAFGGDVFNVGGEVDLLTRQRLVNPQFEIIGRDLGYHVQQLPKLEKILADGDEKSLADRFNDDGYRKHQYFAGDAIMSVLEDHASFLRLRDEAANTSGDRRRQLESKAAQYGFSIYHDSACEKILKSAAAHAHFAPGSGNVGMPRESILDRMNTPRTTTSRLMAARSTLDQQLKSIDKMDGDGTFSKSDIRMKYFLDDPEGKKMFNAYLEIMRAYREANIALIPTLGYDLRLRDESPSNRTTFTAAQPARDAAAIFPEVDQDKAVRTNSSGGTPPVSDTKQGGLVEADMHAEFIPLQLDREVFEEDQASANAALNIGFVLQADGNESLQDYGFSATESESERSDAASDSERVPPVAHQLLRRGEPPAKHHHADADSDGTGSASSFYLPLMEARGAAPEHAASTAKQLQALLEHKEGANKQGARRQPAPDRKIEGLEAVNVPALIARFEGK